MSAPPASRNESFVRAARRLLAFQLTAAAGAVALTAWAVVEVRALVEERDRLAAQVAQMGPPSATAPLAGTPASPAAAEPPAATLPEPAPAPESAPSVSSTPEAVGNEAADGADQPGPLVTPCILLDGTRSQCPLPWRRVDDGICLDVRQRRARCPAGGAGPVDEDESDDSNPPPPPPSPARDCRSVEGRPIVCAPPYRGTPVPGVCLDRNNRPMRCPPGQPPREPRPTVTPTRPPATRIPTEPSGTTRPRPSTSPTATPTRPRPSTSSVPSGRQPSTTATPSTARPTTTGTTRPRPAGTAPVSQQPQPTTSAPQRTVRPVTTAPTTTRPVRRPVPTSPESNQAQPQ